MHDAPLTQSSQSSEMISDDEITFIDIQSANNRSPSSTSCSLAARPAGSEESQVLTLNAFVGSTSAFNCFGTSLDSACNFADFVEASGVLQNLESEFSAPNSER